MYIATIKLDTLKQLAELPDGLELVEVKPDTGGGSTGDRWNGNTRVTIQHPEVPYTGNHQGIIDGILEQHAGSTMTYGQLKDIIVELGEEASASQVRAVMKNYGLLTKE